MPPLGAEAALCDCSVPSNRECFLKYSYRTICRTAFCRMLIRRMSICRMHFADVSFCRGVKKSKCQLVEMSIRRNANLPKCKFAEM